MPNFVTLSYKDISRLIILIGKSHLILFDHKNVGRIYRYIRFNCPKSEQKARHKRKKQNKPKRTGDPFEHIRTGATELLQNKYSISDEAKQKIYLEEYLRKRLLPFLHKKQGNVPVLFWPYHSPAHYSRKVVHSFNVVTTLPVPTS